MSEEKRVPAMPGPLAPFAAGFHERLLELGYVSSGFWGQRGLFAHLDRWLVSAGLGAVDISPTVLDRFLEVRAAEGYATKLTRNGLVPLVGFLAEVGIDARPVPSAAAVDQLLARFVRSLVDERGLGSGTVVNYERVARQFLASCPDPLEASVAALTAADVVGFVLARSQHLSVAAMQTQVGGMRALLRFVYVAGLNDRALASAIPNVARRRQELPRALPGDHVRLLLDGCDRATAVGLRDFAVLVVLARLGLRASEVAGLTLDDIDWAAGEIRIRGKGPRMDKLPLPLDVGAALVDYLQHARPDCVERRLFVRACAPRHGLTRQAIGGLVRAASVRAGLPAHGPHRLRHTVATELLRQGAPLVEIAQLLRHQTIQVTAVYAKVDLEALRTVAQPWPASTP